jgi:hypothetical protein
MTIYDVLVVGLFAMWLVLTVLKQMHIDVLGGGRAAAGRALLSWVVPVWHFFAPTPGRHVTHILYRDRLPSGGYTPWREIPAPKRGQIPRVLWNPSKLRAKALIDVLNELSVLSSRYASSPQLLTLSVPYLLLLNHVSRLPRWYEAVSTQFVLIRRGEEGDELVLLSGHHSLAA